MTVRRTLVLLAVLGALSASAQAQAPKVATPSEALRFTAKATKLTFYLGDEVRLIFRIKNTSKGRVLVSRYMSEEFMGISVIGPDRQAVQWHGRIRSVAYEKDAFLFLEPNQEVSAIRTISAVEGEGFSISRLGRYTVFAEYSLGLPEYFEPIAPKSTIPIGLFKAPPVHFTIVARRKP